MRTKMFRKVLSVTALTAMLIYSTVLPVFAGTSASGAVIGACHVSPIVADLDRSLHFYRDLLGLEVSSAPSPGSLPWDTKS